MPPEQALGGKVDARSDLYGLGATLYEMVCGRPPFSGHDPVAIISQHLNTPPVAPSFHNPSLPPALNALILKLLAKNPQDRPSSADEVLAALQSLREQIEQGEVVVAAEAPAVTPIGRVAWGTFVGRAREMEQLKERLADAFSSLGSVAMVVGDAGIGKTRLLQEFATYARLRGAQVLWGTAYEGEARLPYGPFAEALRDYVSRTSVETLRQAVTEGSSVLAPMAPELKVKLPDLPEPPPVAAEAEAYRLFQEVTEFLKNASTSAPLVLVLEDLQWADKSSCSLLQHLARRLAGARLLVAISCREAELEPSHPIREALPHLRRESGFWELPLKGLRESEVKELITVLAEQEVPRALVLALHQETEGNPFFVQETLKHLIETEALYQEEGRWTSKTAISDIGLPESVREVMERRLAGLSEECRRLLQVGAVLGRRFSLSLAQRVAELDEEVTLRAVEEALAVQVVREQRQERRTFYQFTSTLLRENLHGRLSAPRRERLHLRAARALEEAYPDRLEDYAAELAYHYREAGEGAPAETAYRWTVKAAQQAMAAYAPGEAVPLYRSALELADAVGLSQGEKAVLLSDLALAQRGAGDFEGAIQSFEEAAGGFETAGDVAGAARAYALLAWSLTWQGQLERTLHFSEKGLELVGPADRAERAVLLAYHAMDSLYLHRFDTVFEEAAEAESLAEHVTDPLIFATLFRTIACLYLFACFPQKAQEAGDRAVAVYEAAGELAFACYPRLWSLASATYRGQVSAGGPEWAELRQISEQRLAFQPAYTAAIYVAWQRLLAGDLVEAERIGEEVLTLASEMRVAAIVPLILEHSALLMMLTRRYDQAEARLAALHATYEAAERAAWLAGPWPYRILLCLEKGDMAQARKLLADRPQWPFEEPLSWGGASNLLACGEALAELGETEGLDACYQRLRELNGRGVEFLWPCLVPRVIAMLDALSRRWKDASTYFEKALSLARRLGYRLELAATLLPYAKMRLARDAPGDAEAATAMLNEALQLYQDMGLPQRAEKVLAVKMQAQEKVAPGLTPPPRARRTMHSTIEQILPSALADAPSLARHSDERGTVTILFTDIEGSTALAQRLGDKAYHALLAEHNRILREQVARHGGHEVKSLGDGFMVAFASAARALACAVAIQKAFGQHNETAEEPINVRIGLNTGESIEEAGDYFGTAVTLAARIAARAQGGQILVSEVVRAVGGSLAGVEFRDAGRKQLKGIKGRQRVYEVVW
jgi:class 3 adenylate cyclase